MKKPPRGIFVLRNNDYGDVLVTTPLLHGLRKAFPTSRISIGVGDWAKNLLEKNNDIDEVHCINAPWHNKQICRFPANSPRTFLDGLFYILLSSEVRALKKKDYSHGIDVLGSRQGAWLLKYAGIKNRYGVRGYAGGDNWCKKCLIFEEDRNVAKSGLEFLSLLNASNEISARPRIFLSLQESNWAEKIWGKRVKNSLRVILAPGGGFEEKLWGNENFSKLAMSLVKKAHSIVIIGGKEDRNRVRLQRSSFSQNEFRNFCGKFSLRQSAAIVSKSDFVFTNSSLPMHLAGAYGIPSITLLGEWYDSSKLHKRQWGYPEGSILGREILESKTLLATPKEALNVFERWKLESVLKER